MIGAVTLFAVGIFLSAFFSGSETGFYRVTRVRLLLDGIGGDPVARGLLWLSNHPALFVATTLIGNNLANYFVSLALVMLTQHIWSGASHLVDLIAPVAFSPIVFVYGELLPKYLFYHAPNLLLRRGGPLFFLFAILFAPLSAVLWLFGRLLEAVLGGAPLRIRLALARQELQQVLEEGHEAGILRPAQRDLAQSLFAVASRPVVELSKPVNRVASVRLGASKADFLRMARRHGVAVAPVVDPDSQKLAGYVRVVDLCLDESETIQTLRPLQEIPASESHIAALIRMQTSKQELARVIGENAETVGLLYADDLTAPLLRTP